MAVAFNAALDHCDVPQDLQALREAAGAISDVMSPPVEPGLLDMDAAGRAEKIKVGQGGADAARSSCAAVQVPGCMCPD
jgi:hypothetical protein